MFRIRALIAITLGIQDKGLLSSALNFSKGPVLMDSLLSVPSASMTRLMRSRTASGSSVTSLEGQRSRSHTGEGTRSRSHTGDGSRNRAHTDTRIELTPNSASNAEQPSPKSMEVSC